IDSSVFIQHLKSLESGRIGAEFIGNEQFAVLAGDMLCDEVADSMRLSIRDVDESNIPAALPDTDDDLLRFPRSDLSNAALLAADVSLIHLHDARQLCAGRFLHGMAAAMAQIPCCLVADSVDAFPLVGR